MIPFLPHSLAFPAEALQSIPAKEKANLALTAQEKAALGSLHQVSSCRHLPWQEADPAVRPVSGLGE